jgi:hypothetical protein
VRAGRRLNATKPAPAITSPSPTATAAPVSDEPVHASVLGPHVISETPATAVVVVAIDDAVPPAETWVGAVVGGAVVGGAVVSVGVHLSGSPTVAVTVLENPSGHVPTAVIVIAPVTPPGTTVVACVLPPPGTGFVTTETLYATPSAIEVAVTVIGFFASPFVMVQVTRCEPSEHDATPVTVAGCAPAGTAIANDAATIARQVKDFTTLIASTSPLG